MELALVEWHCIYSLLLPENRLQQRKPSQEPFRINASKHSRAASSHSKLPKNLRYPRHAKVPPDTGINRVPLKTNKVGSDSNREDGEGNSSNIDDSVWSPEEIGVISSLFERRMPQKFTRFPKARPLPHPTPHKVQPVQLPTSKQHVRSALRSTLSWRTPLCDQVSKNPEALVGIAREIGALPCNVDASEVLHKWAPFLRKGSLSMTIRELGHMGLPEKALQTLCWAQKHRPEFFPDDRILASTVEVLARNRQLKMKCHIEQYLNSASQCVAEAMARGFIGAGSLNLARKVLLFAKDNKRILDSSIHAKLILAAGKNPDRYKLAAVLLDELGEREDLDLKPQDCTAIMKVCTKLGRFETVEILFNWFKECGRKPTVVMYTTVIHSRYCNKKYREGLAIVWEMEETNCLLDLPAYRVVIRLCVALDDLERAARYFSRLKEAGFTPTYDIFRDMIKAYVASGRLAKSRQICKELETEGLKLDKGLASLLLQMEQMG